MLLKRSLDVIISATALVLLSPVLLAVAVLIIVDSGLPIFFKQDRVGRNFHSFEILKFRSMFVGAKGSAVTVKGDARITRVGRLLRATKLDEVPQFWNVIRGDMSLVGPRPEVAKYVALYPERYKRILQVRPGITDLASVKFRNEEAILAQHSDPQQHYAEAVLPTKLHLAEDYVKMQCLKLDFKILLHTATVTIFPGYAGFSDIAGS